MVPHGDTSVQPSPYTDLIKGNSEYVDYFLSISPSEYIRRYKRERRRENVAHCNQSVNNLLEKCVYPKELRPDAIQKSLNTIRGSFRDLSLEYLKTDELANPSLQSLIAHLIYLSNKKSNTACEREEIQYSCNTNEVELKVSVTEVASEKVQNVENYFVDVAEDTSTWP